MNIKRKTANIFSQYFKDPVIGKPARDYMLSRGISVETCIKYNVGFAPKGNLIYKTLKDDQNLLTKALEANIVKYSKKTNQYFDNFSEHVVFPIIVDGVVESLTGRRIYDDPDDYLKHWHLKGSDKFLFNNDGVKEATVPFIVESPINALTLLQQGYIAGAVLGGNSLRAVSVNLFKDKHVILGFDTDKNGSGQRAALKFANQLFVKCQSDADILKLPVDVDINDYFKTHTLRDFKLSILSNKIRYSDTPHFKDWVDQQRLKLLEPVKKRNANYKGDSKLELVKQVPISQVLSHLSPTGMETFGNVTKYLCPIHNEKSPSMVAIDHKGYCRCYGAGCGFYGDSVDLVMEKFNCTFSEAMQYILKI